MAKATTKSNRGFIFLIVCSILTAALAAYVIADGLLHRSSFLKDKVFITTLSAALDKFPAGISQEDLAKVKVLYIDGNYYPEWGYVDEGFNLRIGYDAAAQSLRNSIDDEDFTDDDFDSHFVQAFSEVDITDFSSLAYFPNLEFIRIYYQPALRDIGFFENMNSLADVYLQLVNVSDFSPLNGKTALKRLTVAGCEIKDTDIFAELTNLDTLVAAACDISDIGGIAALENLVPGR